MRGKRKWAFDLAFLFLVLGLTLYGLFHGSDLSALGALLGQARWAWWLLGLGLVVAFILGESLVFHDIFRTLGTEHRLSHCFLYSFIGFFFSCITPSAGGGQPAQVYFMKKDGVDPTVSVPVMLLVTITYKLVLVLYALGILLLRPKGVLAALEPVWFWFWLGLFLNVCFISLYVLLILRPGAVERLLGGCIRLAGRVLKPEKTEGLQKKLEGWMEQYRMAAGSFLRCGGMLLRVMLLTILQRTLLFGVTYAAMRSFGLRGAGVGTVAALQAVISLGTDLLPLPGGMGASESLFLKIFPALCGAELTLPVLLVSRGLNYYGQLLISAVFTVVAVFTLGRRKEEKT